MGFRRQDLQEAFFVPGTHAFRVYGYGTADPLAELLQPGYFEAARAQLRPGELILVGAGAEDHRALDPNPTARQRSALVMVAQNARGVPLAVRLVQDFGGPDGPTTAGPAPSSPASPAGPTPTTPARRRRGRPPGSRNKKSA